MGKILAVTNTNLGGIEVIFETSERYFEKYDIFRDTDSGLEFFAVDRPRQNLQGKWEITCRIITPIHNLEYIRTERPELY